MLFMSAILHVILSLNPDTSKMLYLNFFFFSPNIPDIEVRLYVLSDVMALYVSRACTIFYNENIFIKQLRETHFTFLYHCNILT